MKIIRNLTLLALLLNAGIGYGQQVLSLKKILQEINTHNPILQSFYSQIKSQDAKVDGAKAWMAPMVGLGTFMTPYPGSTVMDESDRGAWMISAEQDIPNRSKTKAREEYLAAQSSITSSAQAVQANLLRARAKTLYFDLLVAHKKIAFQRQNQNIMGTMKKLAEIRYPFNQGPLGQIFKAEGRFYESENMILMTESEIKSKKIALNALMYRPLYSDFIIDTSQKVTFIPLAVLDTAYFAANKSEIKQMDRSIRAMELNINQMRQQAKPDFRIRYEHMANRSAMMPNQYTLMGMVSIPIAPWSSKMYKSEIISMNFEQEAMRQQKEGMILEMLGMSRSMETELQNMQTWLKNYETKILPALNKNLQVSMLSYQENKGDVNTVIDGWEAVNMSQMNYLDQLQKFYQMIAEYERNIEK